MALPTHCQDLESYLALYYKHYGTSMVSQPACMKLVLNYKNTDFESFFLIGAVMITPAFELSQEPDLLILIINVPYARVSEVDIYIDGEDFKFYAKPYFLRLALPGRIVEDGREKATYDADKGIFTIKVPKETPGQYFEGLNMLTALLAPKGSRSAKPLVEEIGASADCFEEEEETEEFDWQIEQVPFEEPGDNAFSSSCCYGFGNLRSGVFQRLQDELSDVIDIKNPDSTPAAERRQARLAAEDAKFDPNHYLADLFEDDSIQHLLKYRPWWSATLSQKMVKQAATHLEEEQGASGHFTKEEKQQLRSFTNKSYLLDKKAYHQVYLSLVDIILAYTYEVRITEGENNVESPWNIRKLSGTLCWFESYNSVKDVLVSFGRRVLAYPLYRHYQLILKAIQDAAIIFQLGKASVLKCLLNIHKIFQENDPAYVLNDLYITDYCVWIQKAKSGKLAALSESLQKAKLTKADLGYEIEELEQAALLVQEEENKLKPASGAFRQHQATSESKTDDSDDSSSSLSSETEESASYEESSSSSEDDTEIKEKTPVAKPELLGRGNLEENPAILCASCGVASNLESADYDKRPKSDSPTQSFPKKLIEELGEQVHSVVSISEPSKGSATGNCNSPWDKQVVCSVESNKYSEKLEELDPQGNFLEVSPEKPTDT
uniref:Protein SHQ1 homolog n=2 Tax=Latimeria chalumnae TaxID=7897 RepID=H3B2P9_LATCH